MSKKDAAERVFDLSARLSMAAKMVTGRRLCDVGCDHGYLPIELLRAGVIDSAIACDINEGPLSKAAENIEKASLTDVIETRLSDGLLKVGAGEADCITVCGMGGRLIGHVIETNPLLCQTAEALILQPQSDADWLKGTLSGAGYVLLDEDMVEEDGKFYLCMKFAYRPDEPNECGSLLTARLHPVWHRFLEREEKRLSGILAGLPTDASERQKEVSKELERVRVRLSVYGDDVFEQKEGESAAGLKE